MNDTAPQARPAAQEIGRTNATAWAQFESEIGLWGGRGNGKGLWGGGIASPLPLSLLGEGFWSWRTWRTWLLGMSLSLRLLSPNSLSSPDRWGRKGAFGGVVWRQRRLLRHATMREPSPRIGRGQGEGRNLARNLLLSHHESHRKAPAFERAQAPEPDVC